MTNLDWLVQNTLHGDVSGDNPNDLQRIVAARRELAIVKEDAIRPKVGIGVGIFWGQNLLFHKRKGSHAANVWAFPGGHLEYGETFAACAMREVEEECGPDLRIKVPKFWTAINTPYPEEKRHYVTIFMYTVHTGGLPVNMEPNKGEDWSWFHIDMLPSPLMLGIEILKKEGFLKPKEVEKMCA